MWAYETTFYQIYPLGFCGAPRENAAPVAEDELAQAANAAPNPDAPIMKIAQWADYLQELGVGAVLINPPLESDSHGYDTRSLRHIDRRLGGDADFAAVCDTLHAHGMQRGARRRLQPRRSWLLGLPRCARAQVGLAVQGLVPH